MTYDKNGTILLCGDIVEISGAYFKNDNGFWFVEQDGTNAGYSGNDLTLQKIGKTGKISKQKHHIAFWPLACFVNDNAKKYEAKEHNAAHATIERVEHINNAHVVEYIRGELAKLEKQRADYMRRFNNDGRTNAPIEYFSKALDRLTAAETAGTHEAAEEPAQPEETPTEAATEPEQATEETQTAPAEDPTTEETATPEELPDSYYIENKETGKLELHFDKSDYMELSDSQKQTIKSNFLFSRRSSAWISRCKFPNLYRARKVAEDIGLYNAGSTGDRLSFEEQQERKADRAEARAERMEARADKAVERSKALTAPIERMRGDIAFFTQPNINTTAGRAFTKQRERMWASWDRGIEEFRKSDYYRQRAEAARETADKTKTQDKGFCQRRISEAEKAIRAQKRNIEHYQGYIERLDNGETINRLYSDKPITRPEVEKWIQDAEDIIIEAYGKIAYYDALIQAAGGIIDRDTLSKGDLVKIKRWSDPVRIIRKGPKNFTYEFTTPHMKYADGRPMQGGAAYAEIEKVI